MVLTLAPFVGTFTEPHVHFVGVYFTPNDAGGSSSGGSIPRQLRNDLKPCAVYVVLPRLEDNYSGRWFRLPLFP